MLYRKRTYYYSTEFIIMYNRDIAYREPYFLLSQENTFYFFKYLNLVYKNGCFIKVITEFIFVNYTGYIRYYY